MSGSLDEAYTDENKRKMTSIRNRLSQFMKKPVSNLHEHKLKNTWGNVNTSYPVNPQYYHIGYKSTGVNPKKEQKYLDATEITRIKYILLNDIRELFNETIDENIEKFIDDLKRDTILEHDVSIDYNLEKKIRSFITKQLQQKYNYSAEFIYCIMNTYYVKEQHTFEPINNDNEYTTSNPCKKTVNIYGFADKQGKITGVLNLKPEKHSHEDNQLHLLHLGLLKHVREIRGQFTEKIFPPMIDSGSPRGVDDYIERIHRAIDETSKEIDKELQEDSGTINIQFNELQEASLKEIGQQIRNNTAAQGIFTKTDEPTQDAVENAIENLTEVQPIVNTNKNEAPVKFLDMWRDIDNLKNLYPDIQDEIEPVINRIKQDLMKEHNMNPLTQLMLFMHLNELFKDLTVSKTLVKDIKNRIKTFKNVKPGKKSSWWVNWTIDGKKGGKKTRKQRKRKTKKQKKKSNKKTKSRR